MAQLVRPERNPVQTFRFLERLYIGGVTFQPGDTADLDADLARSLGASVQPVRGQELPTTSIEELGSNRAMKARRVKTR